MPPMPHGGYNILPPGVPPPGAVPMTFPPMPPLMMPPPPLPPSDGNGGANNGAEGGGGLGILGIKFDLHLNLHPQNFAQTVVLTRLPPFLRGVRSLRDASYPCGTARTVHVGCCLPSNDVDRRKNIERGLTEKIVGGLQWNAAEGGVAVVKMGHYSGARDLAGGMMVLSRCGLEGRLPLEIEVHLNDATTTTKEEDNLPSDYDDGANATMKNATMIEGGINDDDEAATTEVKELADDNNVDGSAPTTTSTVADENSEKELKTPDVESLTKEPPIIVASKYSQKEESDHHETLRQLKNMRVHHLFSHHIPDPVPPDMTVPQPDPVPDPTVPVRLLEALTTLRLRYDESVKEADELFKSGMDPLSTTVSIYGDQWGGHTEAAGTEDDVGSAVFMPTMKLDTAKLAAAAGGGDGYDEEADPLNAPEVITEVMKFKKRLEDQNSKGKARRIAIVNERMARKVAELLERGRWEREERKKASQERQQQLQGQDQEQQAMEVGVEAPQDTGRRGVSNLPAWLTKGGDADTSGGVGNGGVGTGNGTIVASAKEEAESGKKRKFVPSEANLDINARKQTLNVNDMSVSEIRAANMAADAMAATAAETTTKEGILCDGTKFPFLPPSAAVALKQYVTSRIVDYLGEEESTLIEFIMKELSKEGGCTTMSLLEEMKMVLDEECEDFVLSLYRKMME